MAKRSAVGSRPFHICRPGASGARREQGARAPWVGNARASVLALAVLAAAGCGSSSSNGIGGPGSAERGRVVAALAGGCGCHTPEDGPVGAGGKELETPFGIFYSTNLTSDSETGIGGWTDDEIDRALRGGVLRDGSIESPVMPYYRYAGMSDEDARDLIAWLRTLPAIERANRPHDVSLPLPRLAFRGWRMLFAPSVDAPERAPASGIERGRYLADHVSICGDCHTPRSAFGAPERSLALAGAKDGPLGEEVPNITSDPKTGIGKWDAEDIVSVLELGMLPDMDNVQGLMAEVVDGIAEGPGYGAAPRSDLEAIAAYIKTVPPVERGGP